MREIILDIETSGLDYKEGHRIIEIGCVELNRKEVGSHFHRYINPLKTLTEENIKIHGITNEFLEDKPLFEDVAEEFLKLSFKTVPLSLIMRILMWASLIMNWKNYPNPR